MLVQPTMERSKPLRLFTILILYIAQGIPLGLFDFAIPAWMAANGATGAEIGFVIGMIGIPWSLKFINGFLMDRYTFLAMGRRRAWLIGSQIAMVAALCFCAFLSPEPRDELLLGIIALIVNAAVVFQDVAADALAVDMVTEDEQGFAGGLMSGGQALGISISAASVSYVIFAYGSSAAYLTCAVIMALVTSYLIWIREREGERRLPWSSGEVHEISRVRQTGSWWLLVKEAFGRLLRGQSILWIVTLLLKGMGYGFLTVAVPLIAVNYAGWNEAQLGSANGLAQLAAGLAAITLGGWLTTRIGLKPFMIWMSVIFGGFILLYALAVDYWPLNSMMWTLVLGWTVLYFLLGSPQAAITMVFCDPKTSASQFSIYMAFFNQGISLAGFSFALIEGYGGVAAVLLFLSAVMLVATLLVCALRLPGSDSEAEPNSSSARAP